jgi:hypothetical protein
VLIVLALVVVAAMRGREKAQRRQEAQELRQQADPHTPSRPWSANGWRRSR